MCKSPFLWGMAAGIMVGVTAEMIVCPRPKCRKTAVGQAMQRMGNATETVNPSNCSVRNCALRKARFITGGKSIAPSKQQIAPIHQKNLMSFQGGW